MYSLVLMAALTTGGDVPEWGRHGGCHGCWGGCYGCWGGCWGCRGGCFGCWGGCYGGWGGCYGCWGGYSSWGCWGGCYGGCYGGYAWGGWGGGWGGGYVYAPTLSTYSMPVLAANTLPSTTTNPVTSSMYYNPSTSTSNRATIIVHVPANAKLMVDGKATTSTSDTRRFYSPPLEPGQEYHYSFKAVIDRDGKPATATRRLDVRAGETYEISITVPRAEDAAETSRPVDKPNERRVQTERSARSG